MKQKEEIDKFNNYIKEIHHKIDKEIKKLVTDDITGAIVENVEVEYNGSSTLMEVKSIDLRKGDRRITLSRVGPSGRCDALFVNVKDEEISEELRRFLNETKANLG